MNNLPEGGGNQLAGGAAGILSSLIPTQNRNGGTSVGGAAASGALKGAASLAMLGPIGMAVGGIGGGLASFLQAKQMKEKEQEEEQALQKQNFMNFVSSSNLNQSNGSNIPMSMGGKMYADGGMINPTLTEFNVGGTHESNPLGGIPQGMNAQGKMRTVEQGETKFRFKDGDYVFSNRLSPLNTDI